MSAILPWAVEQIETECQRAEQESLRADREREEKEKLIAALRAKGFDPNKVIRARYLMCGGNLRTFRC
ncbi:hypothetical protein [Chamaesiphon minutus]|uniref:hypothetical protein n=1 Tax=Chamaesiphon minutus TaxID=1173032 RepID=UPI0002F41C38|nr:hypothetical protein [Chamaesiphon minutus]